MNRLAFVLDSRGFRNSVARTWQVTKRFGLTPSRMEKRLHAFADLVATYGSFPSLPITATVLGRNPEVARRLEARGVELCVHGLVHTDLSKLGPEAQAQHIHRAIAIFRKHGVEFTGFRSPYLKYNDATLRAVTEAGFDYDSNLPFYWEPPGLLSGLSRRQTDGLARGLRFYRPTTHPADRSMPRFIGGLVEIPVSLPDDEILLDRMGLPVGTIGRVWSEMAKMAYERGELLTLQVHPERALMLGASLRQVLDYARSTGGFWIATMGEIARWWTQRTGLRVHVERVGEGRYRIVHPPAVRLAVTLVEPATRRSRSIGDGEQVALAKIPLVGIHPDVDHVLANKVRDMGYLIEKSEDRGSYPAYVEPDAAISAIERDIANLEHPLLADGAWPKPFCAALTVTGDVDCLTLGDFLRRFKEG